MAAGHESGPRLACRAAGRLCGLGRGNRPSSKHASEADAHSSNGYFCELLGVHPLRKWMAETFQGLLSTIQPSGSISSFSAVRNCLCRPI